MPRALAIDIGGTKLALGVVDDDGAVVARARAPTDAAAGPDAVIDRLVAVGRSLIDQAGGVDLVGVGCCGPLDPRSGVIRSPPNLPGWRDVPLGERLRAAFARPVVVENDANAAAVGEHRFGAAKGVDDFAYVTVSTGIGGAAFVDGRLLLGKGGNAAEIGHATIALDGWPCPCGSTGCVEAYASGPAIARRARASAASSSSRMVALAGSVDAVDTHHVVAAARDGDPVAVAVWRDTTRALGALVANLVQVYDSRLVVIGGGVAEGAGALLLDDVRAVARARALPAMRDFDVVGAALGDDVGVLGAAAAAFDRR